MKVILAVDGSSFSHVAAASLASLPLPGRHRGVDEPAELEFLISSVVNPPEVIVSAQSEMWYPQFIEHQQELAAEALAAAESILRPTAAEITTHQMSGHIGHMLVSQAKRENADLIVVGAKGHTAIGRILLGSVSDYVATHATCSVLVIRPPMSEPVGENPPEPREVRWNQISVAVDQRDVSQAVIKHLCRYGWTNETLTTLTASVRLEVFREDMLSTTTQEAARRRTEALRCAEAAADQLRACGVTVTAETVETDHIGEGLLRAAEAHGSDLIVLGDSGRGAVTRFLLGSTSRYVLRHAHCSVMIVRDPHEP